MNNFTVSDLIIVKDKIKSKAKLTKSIYSWSCGRGSIPSVITFILAQLKAVRNKSKKQTFLDRLWLASILLRWYLWTEEIFLIGLQAHLAAQLHRSIKQFEAFQKRKDYLTLGAESFWGQSFPEKCGVVRGVFLLSNYHDDSYEDSSCHDRLFHITITVNTVKRKYAILRNQLIDSGS